MTRTLAEIFADHYCDGWKRHSGSLLDDVEDEDEDEEEEYEEEDEEDEDE